MRRTPAARPFKQRPWPAAALLALSLPIALLLARTTPAAAEEIAGRPRVVDGDTLDFAGRVVRLYGIDAPELDQSCRAAGRDWPCGLEARWAALNRLSPHWVTCVPRGHDATGTERAVCYLAGIGQHDLGAWLLRQGWAVAEPDAEPAYAEAQSAAKAAAIGLWRGSFIAPWAWRLGQRNPDEYGGTGCSACDARHQRLKEKGTGSN